MTRLAWWRGRRGLDRLRRAQPPAEPDRPAVPEGERSAAADGALWIRGWLTLVYAVLLAILFDLKSRREERWLVAKFLDYETYRKRVPKLILLLH